MILFYRKMFYSILFWTIVKLFFPCETFCLAWYKLMLEVINLTLNVEYNCKNQILIIHVKYLIFWYINSVSKLTQIKWICCRLVKCLSFKENHTSRDS